MKLINILTLMFICDICTAQRTPDFQFTLYAQDSRGHKDSIVLGFDSTASRTLLIADFGEVNNTLTPFDSIFEIRINKTRYAGVPRLTSKKVIMRSQSTCQIGGLSTLPAIIEIHSKYPPVSFTWDYRKFIPACVENSFLVRGGGYLTYQHDPGDSINDIWNYTLLTSFGLTTSRHPLLNSTILAPIVGGTSDTIWGMVQEFRSFRLLFPPGISTQEISTTQLKGFPNPCIDQINYDFPSSISGEVVVVNALGQEVFKERIRNVDKYGLQTAGYGVGVHFMYLISDDGRRYSTMFMKSK
jgi:hypothetical protein